jgi:MoaA/NifB/PqqE/SkfB family radical SAM enzyme
MTGKFLNNFLHKLKREVLLIAPLRRLFFYFLEKKLYQDIVKRGNPNWVSYNFPRRAREDNFYITRAIMRSIDRALSKGFLSKEVWRKAFNFAGVHLPKKIKGAKAAFIKKYGIKAPALLAISVTKQCNLRCLGCYADGSQTSREKLPFEIISRIIREQKQLWGSHFTVLTGGEPFLYNDNGKTILDLAAEQPDTFFLVYTNGTLIDEEKAKKLAALGNVTPAISVEGFEKETDERRGAGVYQKILQAFKALKKSGVLFGISITPIRKNVDLVMSDEFMDYYFNKIGAAYAWILQYTPVGRDPDLNLMATPEQRIKMFRRVWQIIKEKQMPVIDFWNCGTAIGGCIAAGRPQVGYLHIDWQGDATPCVFKPYFSQNIIEVYKKGGNLDSILFSDFFKSIRQWQNEYVVHQPADKIGNTIACCPARDHYERIYPLLCKPGVKPIDQWAEEALKDKSFRKGIIDYGNRFKSISGEIWNEEYLAPEKKSLLKQNGSADDKSSKK